MYQSVGSSDLMHMLTGLESASSSEEGRVSLYLPQAIHQSCPKEREPRLLYRFVLVDNEARVVFEVTCVVFRGGEQ